MSNRTVGEKSPFHSLTPPEGVLTFEILEGSVLLSEKGVLNSRVLKWIFERCDAKVRAKDTPIGRIPEVEDRDTTHLNLDDAHVNELLSVDIEGWLAEVPLIKEHFARFGSHLPEA